MLAVGAPVTARFVAVVAGPEHELAAAARRVAGGPDRDERAGRFAVVLDRERGTVAGALRVIEGRRPPALREAPARIRRTEVEIRAAHGLDDGGTIVECGQPVILSPYRGKRSGLVVGSLLYRALLRICGDLSVRHVVAVLDRHAYRTALALGLPLEPLAGSAPYGRPPRHAVYGDFTRFQAALTEQAARLRRASRWAAPQPRRVDGRTLARRRVGADIARRVATGAGLDHLIVTA
jgi:hypothetical protein